MKAFNILFLICLLFISFYCIKINPAFKLKSIEENNDKLTFENQWDQSTIAEVEIDDIFTEISDKNLESVSTEKSKNFESDDVDQ